MFQWLEELYRIRRENRLARVCPSCDILATELSKERREKEILLQHILNPPLSTAPEPVISEPIPPKHVPWRVKQQQLEMEDRKEHQRIMKEFGARVNPVPIEKLEKEMGITNG